MLHKCYTLHTNNREDFEESSLPNITEPGSDGSVSEESEKIQRERNLLNADGYITYAELAQQQVDNAANDRGSKSNYSIYLEKYNDAKDGFNTDKTNYTINFNFKENSTIFEKQRYSLIFLQIYINTLENIGKFENFENFNDLFDSTNDKMNSFIADKTKIYEELEYVINFKNSLGEDAEKIENIFKIIKMETERLFNETNYPEYIDDKVVINLTKTMESFNSMTDTIDKEDIYYYIMNMVFIPSEDNKFIKIDPNDTSKDTTMFEYYMDEEILLNTINKAETGKESGLYNRYLQIDISGNELTITKYNTRKLKEELLLIQNPLKNVVKENDLFMIGSKTFQDLYFVKSRLNSVDTSVSSMVKPLLEAYKVQQAKPDSSIPAAMKNATTGKLKPLSDLFSEIIASSYKKQDETLTNKYNTPLFNLIKESKLVGNKLCVISLLTKNDDFNYPRKCSDGPAEPGSNGAAGSTVSVDSAAGGNGAQAAGGNGEQAAVGNGAQAAGGNGEQAAVGNGAQAVGGNGEQAAGGNGVQVAGVNGAVVAAPGDNGYTTLSPELAQMSALLEGQLTPIQTKIEEIKESQSDIKEIKLKSISNNKIAKEEEEKERLKAKEEEVKKSKEKHDSLIEQIEGLETSLKKEIEKGSGADVTVIKSLDKMLTNQTDELSELNNNNDDNSKLKALREKVHESHNLLKSKTNELTNLLSQPKTANTTMKIDKLKNSMLAVEKVMANQTMNISNTVKKSQDKQLSQLALIGQMAPMVPMSYSSNSNITPVRIIFTTLNYNNTDISKLENSIRISMKEVGVRDVDVPIEFKSGSIIANIYPNTEEDASIIKRMHIEIKKRVLNNNLKGLSSNIDQSHHNKLNSIIESIEKLNPKTMDDKEFERLKPRLNQLDNLDKEKLLGLLDSTLSVDITSDNSKDLQDIVSYTKKLIASKSNLNSYNTNENNILLQEFKTAIRNKTLRKLTKYDRDILLSTPDSELWKQIIYLNKKYSDQNPYDTTYVPGYVYMPPDKWETRREIPKCINDKAPISSPAFVFGSGVPSNALEFDSKLLPRFSYREEGSGVFTDDEKFNKEYTNSVMEETDRERLVLSASNTDKYVEKVRKQHSMNHRFDDYNL